ncbi:DUF6638 family protein [Frigidibacter sp. ROC022]|uniref:DUF6638 family protein n=1 Tax=Frigidibacter sp. ROC022 TaxID=2971796 RepID=UPI00215ADD6B|nr:DUF6638 family protein [Frigidibacter sp. ROC022]MCR8724174.1 hypothetical protein [Frigidibacter sp. ROC022]
MGLLIEKGLMFGNLVPVTSSALVERYNRALKKLTGRQTKLTDFHIDLSGYSPEIGDELGDDLYLNQNGCNREFILLTTDQRRAPLLNAKFSASRPILKRFIAENEAELFALTARDAVCGELTNSVYELSKPERLFDIRRIKVEADTTGSHVAEAQKLAGLIERFRNEEDAWWDDVLIAEMIGLAKSTGDVTRNPLALRPLVVDQANFWTSHFGGLYVFRDVPHPAAISIGAKDRLGPLPIADVYDLGQRNEIAHFLEANDLVEPIVKARGIDAAAILGQKMDFILVEAGAQLGLDLGEATRADLRNVARQVGSALPVEFRALGDLKRWAEAGGTWPTISSEHPAYFYTLRARNHADRDLVNQLLAELSPLDVRQLFICHKELFYSLYRHWSPTKQHYVARFLEQEYLTDKAGAREALFGGDEPMADPPVSPPAAPKPPVSPWERARRDRALIDLVGPWGALKGDR